MLGHQSPQTHTPATHTSTLGITFPGRWHRPVLLWRSPPALTRVNNANDYPVILQYNKPKITESSRYITVLHLSFVDTVMV